MEQLPWNEQELRQWAEFWESDMGKRSITQFKGISSDFANRETMTVNPDEIMALVGRRAGVEAILGFIQAGIMQAKELDKEFTKEKEEDKEEE